MNKQSERFLNNAIKRYTDSLKKLEKKLDPFCAKDDDFMDRHQAYVRKYEFEQIKKYIEEKRKKIMISVKSENKHNLTSKEIEKLKEMSPKDKKLFLKNRVSK